MFKIDKVSFHSKSLIVDFHLLQSKPLSITAIECTKEYLPFYDMSVCVLVLIGAVIYIGVVFLFCC